MRNTKKYKGGQSVEHIISARKHLRRGSNPSIQVPNYNSNDSPTPETAFSSISLSPGQKWNAGHGKSFKIGRDTYAIYENPETGKPDLYVKQGESWVESSTSNSFVTPKGLWGGKRKLKKRKTMKHRK